MFWYIILCTYKWLIFVSVYYIWNRKHFLIRKLHFTLHYIKSRMFLLQPISLQEKICLSSGLLFGLFDIMSSHLSHVSSWEYLLAVPVSVQEHNALHLQTVGVRRRPRLRGRLGRGQLRWVSRRQRASPHAHHRRPRTPSNPARESPL